MNSTEHWPNLSTAPNGRSDRFDDLRAAYVARLRTDLTALKRLRARLDRTPAAGEPPLFEELRSTAHAMAGAAAMFEVALVASAAGALEDAALAVSVAPSSDSASARTRLDALIRVVESFRG